MKSKLLIACAGALITGTAVSFAQAPAAAPAAAPTVAVTAGAFFTHHSNLGMTNPNPGIDVLGVKLGLTWTLE